MDEEELKPIRRASRTGSFPVRRQTGSQPVRVRTGVARSGTNLYEEPDEIVDIADRAPVC
jgi:hypothetical protein